MNYSKKFNIILCILIGLLLNDSVFAQKAVRYDLYVKDTVVNYTGKKVKAIAINGQNPGPTLYFTEGDTAEIYIHNEMNKETSIHWHGIILPNEQDGVPYLTTAPIKPHKTHLYKFPLVQSGTFMYHSHFGMQEQSGLHGAIIIHKRNETPIPEYVILLSDWTNEQPGEVLRSLKTANDWYAIKKHSTQNWGAALTSGYFGTKATQEWKRMLPMDVSDVYYNKFFINGQSVQNLPALKGGDKIKLRIINGSSSTYFWLQFAGGKLNIVAADGKEVSPINVDRMIIGIAETYDVILTVPDDMSYEFRATTEDRSGYTSLWLGGGMTMPAPTLPKLNYFKGMNMMNSMNSMGGMKMTMQHMDMNSVMYPELSGGMAGMTMPMGKTHTDSGNAKPVTLNYAMLSSPVKTTLPDAPVKTINFKLTGNMNRYQWDINNLPISKTDKIFIKKGDNVRIVLYNASMMRHPMHLHGHYFRLLNGQGEYSPFKNVIDIMPMETDTIEFNADADGGDWFFHCHVLYHMMSGMGRVFSYENSKPNSQLQMDPTVMPTMKGMKDPYKMFLMDDKMWFYSAGASIQSQEILGNVMAINRYDQFDASGSINYKGNYISETHFGRFLDHQQFLMAYIGSDIRNLIGSGFNEQTSTKNSVENRKVAVLGVQYLLPFFIESELRVDHTGKVRFQLSRKQLAITSRLRVDGVINTDKEYEAGLHYIFTKQISISANYDSDFGPGAGLTFIY